MSRAPDCEHRAGGVCLWASKRCGLPCHVSSAFCARTCPKWGGPVGGAAPGDATGFMRRVMRMKFGWSVGRDWFEKVLVKFERPVAIRRPPNLAAVREALAGLEADPRVAMVGVTGSAIVSETPWPPKDLDVVVVLSDFEGYHRRGDRLALPTRVAGLPCDVFLMGYPSAFFVTLELSGRRLHRSHDVKLSRVEEGIEVVDDPATWRLWDGVMAETIRELAGVARGAA